MLILEPCGAPFHGNNDLIHENSHEAFPSVHAGASCRPLVGEITNLCLVAQTILLHIPEHALPTLALKQPFPLRSPPSHPPTQPHASPIPTLNTHLLLRFLLIFCLCSLSALSFFHFLSCLIHGVLKAEAKAPSSLTHLYDLPKCVHFVPSFLDSVAILAALLKNSSASLSVHCLPPPTSTPFYTLTGQATLVLFLSPHAAPGPSPPASPIPFSCSPSSPESQHCSLKAG